MNSIELAETYPWNGATVSWAQFGQGPPVLLCHGTPWSSFVWRTVIEGLSSERSVYVWDMLGYTLPFGQPILGSSDEIAELFSLLANNGISEIRAAVWPPSPTAVEAMGPVVELLSR